MLRTICFLVIVSAVSLTSVHNVNAKAPVPSAPRLPLISYVLIEAESGEILASYRQDLRLPVASLVKLMTHYVIADQIFNDQLMLNSEVQVSVNAAAGDAGGSTMFLEPRSKVTVHELLDGIVVQSGNDASIALAEYVAGSESGFIDIMNYYAEDLGLANTTFANATGLPTDRPQHSTALDLAMLSRQMVVNFPEEYARYSKKEYTHNKIRQFNRNKLLSYDQSVDGLKTGHTEEAGYCLASSAERNGLRLIAVTLGSNTEEERFLHSRQLLEYGFRFFDAQEVIQQGQSLGEMPIYGGLKEQVNVGSGQTIRLILPRSHFRVLTTDMQFESQTLWAPLERGTELGTINFVVDGEVVGSTPLVVLDPVEEASIFSRFLDYINLKISSFFST